MSVHTNYEVRWKNFKGFKDTGWIKIKPITILLGPNNSGKTSFIDPFLLMNQTLSSNDYTTPLILRGELFDGGGVKDLAHLYNPTNDIFFGFRYHSHKLRKNLKKIGFYPPGAFEVTFKAIDGKEFSVSRLSVYDIYGRVMFTLEKNKTNEFELTATEFKKLKPEERIAIGKTSPRNFLFSPNSMISELMNLKKDREEASSAHKFSADFQRLLQANSWNFSQVMGIASEIGYIGPIREIPHRYYEISNQNFNTVGNRGQNTINLLNKNFSNIKNELNEWVKKFEFGDDVELQKVGESIRSIVFNDRKLGFETNIANSGFGASQILPLVVQALLSSNEALTIAEQPEIHLNPKLQCVLADLFAFMVKKDQRIIVETHSEHLLLRLRYLVANKQMSSDDVAIYFIEKDSGVSKITPIKMDQDGHIPSDVWPKGFFEESMRESLALASAQIRNSPKSTKRESKK